MDSYFGTNQQFVKTDFSINVVLQVIVVNVTFKPRTYGLQL